MDVTHTNGDVPHRSNPALLTVRDVSVQILSTPILNQLQFSLLPGTITGLIGPNGCGKTTLLRAISGYLSYTGSILLDGHEITHWSRRKLAQKLSFVRQAPWLSFDFTVEELVLLGLLPRKSLLESITSRDRIALETVLDQVGLSGFSKRTLHSLSGGERQRAYLAQAILQDSNLLLLDEPTTHLDVCHQYQFLELVKELVDHGKTVLAVFHDLELAARYSDRLLVMHQGRLAVSGTPNHILTEQLLADVFGMHAHIGLSQSGNHRIYYESPLLQ